MQGNAGIENRDYFKKSLVAELLFQLPVGLRQLANLGAVVLNVVIEMGGKTGFSVRNPLIQVCCIVLFAHECSSPFQPKKLVHCKPNGNVFLAHSCPREEIS
jgi:hypothetical protein